MILKNITEITFIKNKNPRKPVQLINIQTQSEAIDSSIKECTIDDMEKIWNVAKSNCKELLRREKWQYTGTFDDFCFPPLLSMLVKWVLIGPVERNVNKTKMKGVDKLVSMVTQVIMQGVKSS